MIIIRRRRRKEEEEEEEGAGGEGDGEDDEEEATPREWSVHTCELLVSTNHIFIISCQIISLLYLILLFLLPSFSSSRRRDKTCQIEPERSRGQLWSAVEETRVHFF